MRNRRAVLAAALLLPGIWVSVQARLRGADDDKKSPDALQTVRAFLNYAVTGQTKAAAELGEPGKSPGREESVQKNFKKMGLKKPPPIVSLHADDEYALAITEAVVTTDMKQAGPLSIRLVKKDKRWLVRDIDIGAQSAENNLKRLMRERPKVKEIKIPKKDK